MMKNFCTALAVLALPALCASAAHPGVDVRPLSQTNAMLKLNPKAGRYVLLPVQESRDDARIGVVVNGKLAKNLNLRLADTAVDYFVPLDLSEWHGDSVVLNIVAPQPITVGQWDVVALSDTFDTSNREKYRPLYHHTPQWGWMNDPNGMYFKDGVYHLNYQYNPYGSKWQNLSWGHSTSRDLINWEHHPVTLEPNGLGMIFSGSAVVDKNNTAGFGPDAVVALFTVCDATQQQALAYSLDGGETFTLYDGNPVITLPTEARDPNMFWHEPTQQWVLTLAHALEHEMLIFTSPDLKNWTLQSSFGKGEGEQSGVWECPDLFELTVPETGQQKWVLICNINPGGPFGGSAAQYFVGDFDGRTFTADKDATGKIPTKWLDYGKDNYATVSFSDTDPSRRTVIGWMSNWQYADHVPTQQYRSANTLARDLHLFTGDDGQVYLASAPSPENLALRDKPVVKNASFTATTKGKSFKLPTTHDGVCEITADLSQAPATMTLSNVKGEKVVIKYDPSASTLSFDRTLSGLTDFDVNFPAMTTAPLPKKHATLPLRIFVDRSSVELFGADGQAVLTNLVFPTEPYTTLTVSGSAHVKNLNIYSIK